MRSVGGVLGGMSLEQTEPFWDYGTAYKLQNSLEVGNFFTCGAAKCGPWGMLGEGCGRSIGRHVS